jgi:protein-disulfide isomerase
MVVPNRASKRTDSNAKVPASVSADRNYGITFNGELTGVPVIEVYEDFQCPVCAQFEYTNGDYLESLIADKKATVVFHTLSFLGPESVNAANAAACSADEGKFLKYHHTLMANQKAENSGAWSNDVLAVLGQVAGISGRNLPNASIKEIT